MTAPGPRRAATGSSRPPSAVILAALAVFAAIVAAGPWFSRPAAGVALADDPNSWTVYHGDPAGHGVSSAAVTIDTSHATWRSPVLDGALYGEPLVAAGRVYMVTENDRVYALSASTGAVLWSTGVGTAVPAGSLPCGDIQPTVGITGTPVVDPGRGELFVVADEVAGGTPAHMLVGLDAVTGRVELTQRVDPPGALPSALLQRTGLTIDDGQVVFGFGGNYGDCSTYHGWVVAVAESGGAPRDFAVDSGPGQKQGAIWMGGGAPAVDAKGNIWVSAGNGSVVSPTQAYDKSDSVLELSPTLQLEQFFAPTDWAADNAADRDLSMEPLLLTDGQVVVAGKSSTAYLLDGSRLGGIGGQQAARASVCSNDVDGGGAVVGTVVYLPCLSGVVALRVSASPPALGPLWSTSAGGGPPIVAGGLVWTLGANGVLSGLDPATGAIRQQATLDPPENHFPTPSFGDGVLLVPSGRRVVAFAASAASDTSPTTASPSTATPTTRAGAHPAATTSGGLPAGALAGLVVGGVLAAGLAAWVVRRRGRPGPAA